MRPTQQLWLHPVSLLDGSFDGNDAYFDRIKGQINSTGSFVSGIDIEPSFDNGNYLHYQSPSLLQRRRENAATKQQRQWDEQRAARRAKEDAETNAQWDWIGRRLRIQSISESEKILIDLGEMFLSGKTLSELAAERGLRESDDQEIAAALYGFAYKVLVPHDTDPLEFIRSLAGLSLRQKLLLAKAMNWGR